MLVDTLKKTKVIELLRLFKSNNRKDFMSILESKLRSKEIDQEILNEFLKLKDTIIDETEYLKVTEPLDKLNESIGAISAELNTLKSDVDEIKKKEWSLEIKNDEIRGLPGEPGTPGTNGSDYVLTEQDKLAIASSIKVPAVTNTVENRTEVIKEIPIVTNEIVQVAVTDEPQVIADKLNTLTEKVEKKVIKGLEDDLKKIRHSINTGGGGGILRGGGLDPDVAAVTYLTLNQSTTQTTTGKFYFPNIGLTTGQTVTYDASDRITRIDYTDGSYIQVLTWDSDDNPLTLTDGKYTQTNVYTDSLLTSSTIT